MLHTKLQVIAASAVILLLNSLAVYMVASYPPAGIFGF